MTPADILVAALIAGILGLTLLYIHRSKKKGIRCIGCPDGAKCSGNCSCCGGCKGCESKENPSSL